MTTDRRSTLSYRDVVDLERYPIDDLGGEAGRALLSSCHDQLASQGACVLPGFLTPAAVEEMVALALELAPQAHHSDQFHTVYFTAPDESLDPAHPRRHQVRSAKRGIAYDLIPADAPVRRLYESDDLTAFIAAVLGKGRLYRSADPLDALQITLFYEGEELGWHFDNSEFSVTLMYQEPDGGGRFEYVPHVRDEQDERYDEVAQVVLGREGLVELVSRPGTLAVFRGHHAIHQVTPIEGPRPRINSVLTYGERPDMRLAPATSLQFYGRVGD